MKKFLLFRLYGPMASWGDIAVGEVRPSFMHPSKSAILGLIAAALGVRREEEDVHRQISKAYSFAVRVEQAGIPMIDYHTAQVPSSKKGRKFYTRREEILGVSKQELNTILSQRDYRMDAFYTIAFWQNMQEAPFDLEYVLEKLNKPEFVLYLGRKSCPLALPIEGNILDAESLKDAFGKAKFSDLELMKDFSVKKQSAIYWEGDIDAGIEVQHVFERRDVPLSRKRWQFDVRKEKQGTYVKEEC